MAAFSRHSTMVDVLLRHQTLGGLKRPQALPQHLSDVSPHLPLPFPASLPFPECQSMSISSTVVNAEFAGPDDALATDAPAL